MQLYHNSRDLDYRTPFGAVETGTEIKLSVSVSCNEGENEAINRLVLRLWIDESEQLIEMLQSTESLYTASINMPEKAGLVWYYFIAETSTGTVYYGNNADSLGGEGALYYHEPPSFQITCYRHAPVPEWFKDGLVYQIFPDRFARDEDWEERCQAVVDACRDLKGQRKFIEKDWYRTAYYEKDEEGKVLGWPFYGGSFRGIESRLNYLKMLGVTVIYLNPVFKGNSNHRYDTGDYMQVDPMLGTEEDFRQLCASAESMGIRIILDGVFSHTGADSIYFDKYGNYGGAGAYNYPDSEYYSWFEFGDQFKGVGYRSWWGIEDLPEVNEDQRDYVDYICGENGVLAHWIEAGASGYRLDVADELPDEFIKAIRARIKAVDPEALLLGEVWEDASNKQAYGVTREYFLGDELDSTMHYPLRDILIDFTKGQISVAAAADRVMSLKENYPPENFYGALNLIGSHDRERILTILGADENYDRAVSRLKMMSALQYALPGVPCVYYGDEVGMTGAADPVNRNGFIWGKENLDIQSYFRQLGVIYAEHSALKNGELEFIENREDVLAFIRENEEERILVIANRSDEFVEVSLEAMKLGAGYGLELLYSQEMSGDEKLLFYPHSTKIILLMEDKPAGYKMDRGAGVLCHVTSIPGGTIGAPARAFVDYIASAGMKLWQILPLNPPGRGNSPYSSYAAFAGDTRLIDRNELPDMSGFIDFCEENREWLEDYAAYTALKESYNGLEWTEWPDDAPRQASEITDEAIKNRMIELRIEQYYFAVQWDALREYANSKGVEIIGDLPIFVSLGSADAWAEREVFLMTADGELTCHAGVPADYFSPEGQNWGNPLYDWTYLKSTDFDWWVRRLEQCRQRYDYVRIDHFRSFSEFFAIPEGRTPLEGSWRHGPGAGFFRRIEERINSDSEARPLRILAEDLGQLDSGVYNLLKLTGYPGMNIYQFSKDEMRSMTDAQIASRVFYTGTHDNQTILGWCKSRSLSMPAVEAAEIIKELYESKAPWVIVQLQDMFLLDDDARINVPGTLGENWVWHIEGDSMEAAFSDAAVISEYFRTLAEKCGRR